MVIPAIRQPLQEGLEHPTRRALGEEGRQRQSCRAFCCATAASSDLAEGAIGERGRDIIFS